MRFLDVKTDYAFKKVFGSEGSKGILLSFLNAALRNDANPVEDLEIGRADLEDVFLDIMTAEATA